jgi:hypothetical protein
MAKYIHGDGALTPSQSTAKGTVPQGPGPGRTGEQTLLQLTELARRHRICWEVWPEYVVARSETRQVGFRLELSGTHEAGVEHPLPGCPACQRVYAALQAITEHILPREDRPSIYEPAPFDHAIHYAPVRKNRPDIVMAVSIFHRGNVNDPVGECQRRCLAEMKQRLNALGVQEHDWKRREEVR